MHLYWVFLEKGSLYSTVAEKLKAIPEIVECHYTTGQYAIFIKVYARDNEHLRDLLSDKVQKIRGVATLKRLSRWTRPLNAKFRFMDNQTLPNKKKKQRGRNSSGPSVLLKLGCQSLPCI
jgi:hypothetical protein